MELMLNWYHLILIPNDLGIYIMRILIFLYRKGMGFYIPSKNLRTLVKAPKVDACSTHEMFCGNELDTRNGLRTSLRRLPNGHLCHVASCWMHILRSSTPMDVDPASCANPTFNPNSASAKASRWRVMNARPKLCRSIPLPCLRFILVVLPSKDDSTGFTHC